MDNKNEIFGETDQRILFNWIFSKILILNRPGVLINQFANDSKNQTKKRLVFEFEDVVVKLQKETIKKLGIEKSFNFWYNLGKEWGFYYFSSIGRKSKSIRNLEIIFKHWGSMGDKNGTLLCKKVFFEKENGDLFLEGKNKLVCKFSEERGLFVGIFAGFLSFLMMKPVEGFSNCSKHPQKCRAFFRVVSLDESWKFLPLKSINNFEKLNFPKPHILNKKIQTTQDFIKFKKISFEKKINTFKLLNKTVIPFDGSFMRFVIEHFFRINQKRILSKNLINNSEKIARKIITGKNLSEKIRCFDNLFSAMGQGIPYVKREDQKILCTLLFPPIDKNTEFYQAFLINGYLNYIFEKKLKLVDIKIFKKPFAIRFSYL